MDGYGGWVRRCGLPFVRRIETKSASGETSAALYATHSTKMTHMPSHLTLPRICTEVGVRVRQAGEGGVRVIRICLAWCAHLREPERGE